MADGTEGVVPFGNAPGVALLLGLVLKVPGRHVKGKGVATYVGGGRGLWYVFATTPNDHTQLHLVMELGALWWYLYVDGVGQIFSTQAEYMYTSSNIITEM